MCIRDRYKTLKKMMIKCLGILEDCSPGGQMLCVVPGRDGCCLAINRLQGFVFGKVSLSILDNIGMLPLK